MSRRLSFEQLAWNRTKRRAAQIRKLVEAIAYDWCDSDVGAIGSAANRLGEAVDDFDKDAAELFEDHLEGGSQW